MSSSAVLLSNEFKVAPSKLGRFEFAACPPDENGLERVHLQADGALVLSVPHRNRPLKKREKLLALLFGDLEEEPRSGLAPRPEGGEECRCVLERERHTNVGVLRDQVHKGLVPSDCGALISGSRFGSGVSKPRDQRGARQGDDSTENDSPSRVHSRTLAGVLA